jgi:SOS-response transcriptional repressor LexA
MARKPGLETKLRIASWMRTVMEQRGWSAEEWARRADTSATNITRILADPKTASLPTSATVAKLSRVASSQPNLVFDQATQKLFEGVPLFNARQVERFLKSDRDMQKQLVRASLEEGPAITTMYKPSPRAFAVRLDTDSLELRGLYKTDLVVVEPVDVVPPTNGSIIIAQVAGKLSAYLYQPPLLVPQSRSDNQPIEIRSVAIIGRAVHLERPLV